MTFEQGILQYIEEKRAVGYDLISDKLGLTSFFRQVGNIALDKISLNQIESFLDAPKKSPHTWTRKYYLIGRFSRFCKAHGIIEGLPLPPARRILPPKSPPYIYSKEEIRRLLSFIPESQARVRTGIDAALLRTFLLLLYGTGIQISEACCLLNKDLDFSRKLMTLRDTRSRPTRSIPFGHDMAKVLTDYMRSRDSSQQSNDCFYFVNRARRPLNLNAVERSFRRLCGTADLHRRDGALAALRMRDMRDTFAVNRLTAWARSGADLNVLIPALSVYLGYARLNTSARYLKFTPEYFRSQLDRLSMNNSKPRWTRDSQLMNFLTNL